VNWEKLPALEAKRIHRGCLNCSTAAQVASMTMLIAVGFGDAFVTKDGEEIYDGEEDYTNTGRAKTVADIEAMAAADPDHDWRITKLGPMHGETFQRHEAEAWVCVESNLGFA